MKSLCAILPLILVGLLVGAYILFDSAFVKCSENIGVGCGAISGNMISQVKSAESYAAANTRLDTISNDLSNMATKQNTKLLEISNAQNEFFQNRKWRKTQKSKSMRILL